MVGKILPVIFAFLLLAANASAMTPMPIGVWVQNEGQLNVYNIEQENMRTGEKITTTTDTKGHMSFDWSNAVFGWDVGDDIKITIIDCATNPICVQTVEIEPTPTNSQIGIPIKEYFDLTGEVCPVCSECPECPKKSCGSCGTTQECICPEEGDLTCPPDLTPYGECNSCCESSECELCEECEECTQEPCEQSDDLASELFAGLLGMAGGLAVYIKMFNNKIFTGLRTGMKTYRGKDGTLKTLHKHPGTRGYHDPNIKHRGMEAHPKGLVDVKDRYSKVNGEWVYGG